MLRQFMKKISISNVKFVTLYVLERMDAHVHEGKKPFKCDICVYSSSKKSHMNRHVASVHEGKRPFKCVICRYICFQKNDFNSLVASVHEQKMPFMKKRSLKKANHLCN